MEEKSSQQLISERVSIFTVIFAGLLILAGSYAALHTVQWHEVTAYRDDTPTTYANLLRYPERFEDDIVSVYGIASTWGTIANWGTAILWRDFDIQPRSTYFLLVSLQAVLIGLGTFALTWEVTRNPWLALFSIPFAYVARINQWNLAEYASLFPRFYAADLAIYFLLFAFVFLLQQRRWAVIVVLLVGGLIHPSLTLYTCAFIGLYWLWTLIKTQDKKLLIWLGLLVGVGLFIVIPRLAVSAQAQGSIPPEALAESILNNQHFYPYQRHLNGSPYMALFVYWMVLFVLATSYWKKLYSSVQQLLIVILAGATLLFLSQYAGNLWNINSLIQLVGGRSTQLLSLVVLPVILLYFWQLLQAGDWRIALPVIVYVLWYLEFSQVPTWPALYAPFLIFSFFLIELAHGRFSVIQIRQSQLLRRSRSTFLWLSVVFSLVDLYQVVLSDTWIRPISVGLFVFFLLLVSSRLNSKVKFSIEGRNRLAVLFACIALFAVLGYRNIYLHAASFDAPANRDLQAAQIWARENTTEDAMFAGVIKSWRPVAERPYFHIFPRGWYVYFLDERLYISLEETIAWLETENPLVEYEASFYSRPDEDYMSLRDIAPIDYLVFEKQHADKSFEVAFENDHFIIYKLPES